jgi:hypothetical protein
MSSRREQYDRLRQVLSEADHPLTAREILLHLEGDDEFDSSHGVATVLGRWADDGDVDVLEDSPYRYRLST